MRDRTVILAKSRSGMGLAISIHAPVKGATLVSAGMGKLVNISIHAPVKGATLSSRSHERPKCYFNPRSREGSDV